MKILYGSQNFGYENSTSDKDWLEVVYPTLYDIVDNRVINLERRVSGSVVKVKDIRLLLSLIEKPNLTMTQIFFPVYTDSCEDLEWFFAHRNSILYYNPYRCFTSTQGVILGVLRGRNPSPKDIIRSEAYVRILKRMSERQFIPSFRDETLQEYRLYLDGLEEDGLRTEADRVMCALTALTPKFKPMYGKLDTKLLECAREEVARLLKERLTSNEQLFENQD